MCGKTLDLDVSVRVFLKMISIYISRLSKDLPSLPHQLSIIQCNPLGDWIEQKGRGRVKLFFLLELGHPSSALRHWTGTCPLGSPGSQSFRLELDTSHFLGSLAFRYQIKPLLIWQLNSIFVNVMWLKYIIKIWAHTDT